MKFLSICSGIDAASVAWNPLGWEAVGFSEIEPFPCEVLKHHYPETPNYGDLTNYQNWPAADGTTLDVLVGGTPCQSFSVAGLRKGLEDPRGNLALTFLGVVKKYHPRWVVWENVPGVLSSTSHDAPDPSPPPPPLDLECDGAEVDVEEHYDSEENHAFNSFLAGLSELGYQWTFRVLDAQHFGVPQRRRRVIVVANPRTSAVHPASVLFEPEGLRGDLTPRRETGGSAAGDVTPCLKSSGVGFERIGDIRGQDPVFPVSFNSSGDGYWREGCGSLRAREQESHEHLVTHSLRGEGFDASEDGTGRGTPIVLAHGQANSEIAIDHCPTLNCNHEQPIIAFSSKDSGNDAVYETGDQIGALNTQTDPSQQVVAFDATQITSPSNYSNPKKGDPCHHLASQAHPPDVAFQNRFRGDDGRGYERAPNEMIDQVGALETVKPWNVVHNYSVRRLTPRECERLQGFPDDYTLIPGKHRPRKRWDYLETVRYLMATMGLSKREAKAIANHPDGPRYKALGNSMAVPVMRWIGEQIEKAESSPRV